MNLKVLPRDVECIIKEYVRQLLHTEKYDRVLREMKRRYEHHFYEDKHIIFKDNYNFTSYYNYPNLRLISQCIFINKYFRGGESYTIELIDDTFLTYQRQADNHIVLQDLREIDGGLTIQDFRISYSFSVDSCDFAFCDNCLYEDDFNTERDFDGLCPVCNSEYIF